MLRCQAQEMYRCPFCRVAQKIAIPSNEYKLLKVMVATKDATAYQALVEAVRVMVQTGAELGEEVVRNVVNHMEDFPSQHLEAPICVELIDKILNGVLTVDEVRGILTSHSAAEGLRALHRLNRNRAGTSASPSASTAASTAAHVRPTQRSRAGVQAEEDVARARRRMNELDEELVRQWAVVRKAFWGFFASSVISWWLSPTGSYPFWLNCLIGDDRMTRSCLWG